jgi:hypothetical protein
MGNWEVVVLVALLPARIRPVIDSQALQGIIVGFASTIGAVFRQEIDGGPSRDYLCSHIIVIIGTH